VGNYSLSVINVKPDSLLQRSTGPARWHRHSKPQPRAGWARGGKWTRGSRPTESNSREKSR